MRIAVTIGLTLFALLVPSPVSAWLLYEHDAIGGLGIRRLSDEDQRMLQAVWQAATSGRATARSPYCRSVDSMISSQSVRSARTWCVGLSTFAALAGDHACVPDEMTTTIEESDWLGPLLVESRDRQHAVSRLDVEDVEERTIAWRLHNMTVQDIDPGLVPRAQNNRSHFLAPLDVTDGSASAAAATGLTEYLRRALARGTRVNAVTMYLHYHRLALREAAALRGCAIDGAALRCGVGSEAVAASRAAAVGPTLFRVLLAESFALHFLQDAFSSGHSIGSWGDLGQRLGSHDHYSTDGLDVRTWAGRLYTAHGDAFMTAIDARIAAAAEATSLAQVIQVVRADEPAWPAIGVADEPYARAASYSACDRTLTTPPGLDVSAREPRALEVLRQLPIPASRAYGMPRFRSEVGAFLGVVLEAAAFGVVGANDQLPASDARLRVGIGMGFALEGAFARFMDGRFMADFMLAVSMHEYSVGRRAIGFGARLRMPFVVLPGDAIYLVVPAALINQEWGYALGSMAADGGLTGLQRQVILAENLSLQLVVGREATVVWFPHVGWQIDVPVIELRGDRLFTGAFATESVLQIGATMTFNGSERAYGVFVGFAERLRRFMPQSCDDGCD